MISRRNCCATLVLAAILLGGVGGTSYAEEQAAGGVTPRVEQTPGRAQVQRRISSKDKMAEDAGKDAHKPGMKGPHGPSMDGQRGSAIAPAPGAFGTDAGSPSDLRR